MTLKVCALINQTIINKSDDGNRTIRQFPCYVSQQAQGLRQLYPFFAAHWSQDNRISLMPIWKYEDTSKIPFSAYTNEEIHKQELEKLFYKSHWCYVEFEAEITQPSDFKRTMIGEKPCSYITFLTVQLPTECELHSP
jgi:hypothetical protein